jgi:hypothetical protein
MPIKAACCAARSAPFALGLLAASGRRGGAHIRSSP